MLRTLRVSELVEQCQQEIQTHRHGEPSNEIYGLELLRWAIVQGDEVAWAGVQQCLGAVVRGWLHDHPSREAACRWQSEEDYVGLAFERFRQATVRQQVTFRTLAEVLVYLRASLHGAILDTLRASSRPKEVSMPLIQEPSVEDQIDSDELWEILQRMLPNKREQRLAYLLFHCGLKSREIVRFCPQEQEIYQLRRIILERVLRNADQCAFAVQPSEAVVYGNDSACHE